MKSCQGIQFLPAGVAGVRFTVGAGGNKLVLNSFSFSANVIASVGSPGPWRVAVGSTFLGLVYHMTFKTTLPSASFCNVCRSYSLAAGIVCESLLLVHWDRFQMELLLSFLEALTDFLLFDSCRVA